MPGCRWRPAWSTSDKNLTKAEQFEFLYKIKLAAPRPFLTAVESDYRHERQKQLERKLNAARSEFNRRLDCYLLKFKVPEGTATKQIKKPGELHFYWLAGYQVKRWSYKKLGEALGRDESPSTVSSSLKESANLIGLQPRKQADNEEHSAAAIREALKGVGALPKKMS